MNYSNCAGWLVRVCDVPIKTPSARDLISGTAGTRAREYSQPDRASNEGYPKVPEDFTITEKAPTSTFTFKKLGHKGRAGWLALCLKIVS